MQYLHFEYNMELGYTNSVDKCHFTIKCIPKDDARQHLLGMDILVHPEVEYAYGEDSFYNKKIYGCVKEPHTEFIFHISGDVEINQTTYEELAISERIGIYRYPYGKCKPGPELLKYLDTFDLALLTLYILYFLYLKSVFYNLYILFLFFRPLLQFLRL